MKLILSLLTLTISLSAIAEDGIEIDKQRAAMIVQAFNDQPQKLIAPLTMDSVKIKNGVGRADVNVKAKFSYYIQTENTLDRNSRIVLIPMATSRFTPTYYQTDEWWDAHKDEKPMPRQPMQDVADWLQEMKLTSNPDLLIIDPIADRSTGLLTGKVTRKPLQEFLLEHYIAKHAKNGVIQLYRGAERQGELEQWQSGKRPASVRYWTPTANYAWRYARKNLNFVDELVAGRAPLFKFEVPVSDFKAMVLRRWPRLTLGTELTKKAHDSFDSSGIFKDHLAGGADFLGEGTYGVEFEVRSNRAGADDMLKYFKGPITIEELAQDRIKVIRESTIRLQKQRPQEFASLEAKADERVRQIQYEAQLLLLINSAAEAPEIMSIASQIKKPEMMAIDEFSLKLFLQKHLKNRIATAADKTEKSLPSQELKIGSQKVCRSVLR